jgi:putative flippase GtrA
LSESRYAYKDYFFAALIGLAVGILVFPVLIHLGIPYRWWFWAVPFFTAPVWVLILMVGNMLAGRFPALRQFSRFVIVGTLNTAIDFSSLNILSMVYGITAGFVVGGINVPGLTLALTNSYLCNKFWVFRSWSDGSVFKDIPIFLTVTVSAIFINSGIVILGTTYIAPLAGITAEGWLNVAKVAATAVSMFWTFFGYKFFVFRPLVSSPKAMADIK